MYSVLNQLGIGNEYLLFSSIISYIINLNVPYISYEKEKD